MLQLQSLAGLLALPLIAWALSERRAALTPAHVLPMIAAAVAVQIAIAGLMLNVAAVRSAFDWPGRGVAALQDATNAGMRLVFGHLAGGPPPYDITHPEHGFVLALQALPMLLTISALSKLLYHWGVLQRVVHGFAWALKATLGVSGPVGTAAAANIFVGMVEAPLFIKPYLAGMSRGGLFQTMTVGMAGIAGTVLAIYASLLEGRVPGAAGHLIVASVISVPAALLLARIMVPELGGDAIGCATDTAGQEASAQPIALFVADQPTSSMDAIAQGTREGVELFVGVTAMLVVAISLVALANMLLGTITAPFGGALTFEQIVGWLFSPLALLIGIPWSQCATAGSLLGTKTVLNEFVAYLHLSAMPADAFSDRSRLIMTYALCGFANLGSLGILIGGLSTMVPARRAEIVALGPRTVVSGTLATLMTAAVVGLLTAG